MKLWADLFSSDVGILSAVVIIVMLGMAAFFLRFFIRHAQDPAPVAAGAGKDKLTSS